MCPGAAGLASNITLTTSSSYIELVGMSPLASLQKMQSSFFINSSFLLIHHLLILYLSIYSYNNLKQG